jgi:fermentation-respiration switch protein FrsA (DUF1100 family)
VEAAAPRVSPQRSRVARALRAVLLTVMALYAALCALGRLGYRRMLYPAPPYEAMPTPAAARLLELRAADGVPVHALEVAAPAAARTVVYFHGNGEVVDDELPFAERLAAAGFSVVLAEYRGYGRSRGAPPTEDGLYADAAAVLDDLAARGTGPERVVLWGVSLGTGVAAEMARRGRGGALVLVAPYTSIPDMARRVAPFLPVGVLVGDRFDTLSKAPGLSLPAVVVHGTDDEVIPFAMGERVAAAIRGSRFERIPGGHHMDCFDVDDALLGRVTTVLSR